MMLLMLLAPAQRSGMSMTCDATDAAATGGMQKQGAHDAADAPCACAEERSMTCDATDALHAGGLGKQEGQ